MEKQNWIYGNRHQLPSGSNSGTALARVERVDIVDAEYEERSPRKIPNGRIVDNENKSVEKRGGFPWMILLLAIVMGIAAAAFYNFFTSSPVAVPLNEEQGAVAASEAETVNQPTGLIKVVTVGVNQYGNLVADVKTPGAGSLHWEDSQGMVASDTITWNDPISEDIEVSPIAGTSRLVPVLITSEGEIKGTPTP